MKQLAVPLGLVALISVVVVVFTWAPWLSRERQHEQRWLRGYVAWAAEIDGALERGDDSPAVGCERRLSELSGETPRGLAGVMQLAVTGCRELRYSLVDAGLSDEVLNEWYSLNDRVLGALTDARATAATPTRASLLAERAAPLALRKAEVFCWPDSQWQDLSEDWELLRTDEFWIAGFADKERSQIHLAPQVCDPLRRFFGGAYSPSGNLQTLQLAQALVILAHEAEHLRSPEASEADVECVALQRVRDLVAAGDRTASYGDLMTGLAWTVGYPELPAEYQTKQCQDGSVLDLRPGTSVWP